MRNNSGGAFLLSARVDNVPAFIVHYFMLLYKHEVKQKSRSRKNGSNLCPRRDLNPHPHCCRQDFKSYDFCIHVNTVGLKHLILLHSSKNNVLLNTGKWHKCCSIVVAF